MLLVSKQNTKMKTLTKTSKQKNINEKIITKKRKVHRVFSCENKLKVKNKKLFLGGNFDHISNDMKKKIECNLLGKKKKINI